MFDDRSRFAAPRNLRSEPLRASSAAAHAETREKKVTDAELLKTFSTAMVSTRVDNPTHATAEMKQLLESAAFRAILKSVRHLSEEQNMTEMAAAENLIRAFRRLDTIWTDYIYHQGLGKIRSQLKQNQSRS